MLALPPLVNYALEEGDSTLSFCISSKVATLGLIHYLIFTVTSGMNDG